MSVRWALLIPVLFGFQDPKPDHARFRRVKEFVGTIKIVHQEFSETRRPADGDFLGSVQRSTSSRTAEYSVRLRGAGGTCWSGIAKCKGSVNVEHFLDQKYKPSSGVRSLTSTDTYEGSGPALSAPTVTLELDCEKGTYQLDVPGFAIKVEYKTKSNLSETTTQTVEYDSYGFTGEARDQKLPASGQSLSGSVKPDIAPIEKKTETASLTWRLEPADEQPYEIVVEPENYDQWIPSALPVEDKTNCRLPIRASLRRKDGETVTEKAKKFTFELSDVSSEPGTCLNLPQTPKKTPDKDLRFEAQTGFTVDASGQKAEKSGDGVEAVAVLSCFDWGAWGTLKVTAEVAGRTIEGHLGGRPDVKEILLPKRKRDSRIADAWKTGKDQPDDSDGEDQPEGDGCAGDGFTLYEEYRGFYEGGEHVRLHPQKKDLFIRDLLRKPESAAGIQLFARLTGLEVHSKLKDDEVDCAVRNRKGGSDLGVMNRNRDPGAQRVRQHAIILNLGPGTSNVHQGIRRDGQTKPGTPKDFVHIEMNPPWPKDPDELASCVAHELLHACNVPHHGMFAGETQARWVVKSGEVYDEMFDAKTNTWVPGGRSLILRRDSDDQRLMPAMQGGQIVFVPMGNQGPDPNVNGTCRKLLIGLPGGVFSGDTNCVMRYWVADAYVPANNSGVRYLFLGPNGEKHGMSLCDGKRDGRGGVNHPDFKPRPRYGDASEGACRKRFCVNDARH